MNIATEHLENSLEEAAKLLRMIGSEKRLQILCALGKGEKNVGALESCIDLSQSALSQHLSKLRYDGLVKTRREAQTIFYSLSCDRLKNLLEKLNEVFR